MVCLNRDPGRTGDRPDIGEMGEWIAYSANGVPFGMPFADANSDGDRDGGDVITINTWISQSTYDERGDTNLDGVVDNTDKSNAEASTATLARGVLYDVDNVLGYAGYVHDPGLAGTKWHVRYRVLESELGRWLTRDPLGNVDGTDLYEYVANGPMSDVDPYGQHGLRDNYTYCREAYEACLGGGGSPSFCRDALWRCFRERWEFYDWYRREKQDMAWLDELPDCPCTLKEALSDCYTERYLRPGPNPMGRYNTRKICRWKKSNTGIGYYHPGAADCVRSNNNKGKGGQQCCYDTNGDLITEGGGAGTPDRSRPVFPYLGCFDHDNWDVEPWELARYLDCRGGDSRFRKLYNEVRPPNNGRKCKSNPTPFPQCPQN